MMYLYISLKWLIQNGYENTSLHIYLYFINFKYSKYNDKQTESKTFHNIL